MLLDLQQLYHILYMKIVTSSYHNLTSCVNLARRRKRFDVAPISVMLTRQHIARHDGTARVRGLRSKKTSDK